MPKSEQKQEEALQEPQQLKKQLQQKLQAHAEIYYALDETYIYSRPGKENGKPIDDSDIKYELSQLELVLIPSRFKYKNKHYVECILPVQGWLYMVKNQIYEGKNLLKLKNKILYSLNDKNNNNRINNSFSKIQYPDLEKIKNTLLNENITRRNYDLQRYGKLEDVEIPVDHKVDKCMEYTCVKYIIRHPFFPGFFVLFVEGLLECLVIFDVYSDLNLARLMAKSAVKEKQRDKDSLSKELSILFVVSMLFIFSPYFIGWNALTQYSRRKLDRNPSLFWKILISLFDIAPIGVVMLFFGDIYHWFESFILMPTYYLFTGGNELRNISFEELGFYKLRRVTEIFAESLPQACLQLYILRVITKSESELAITTLSVVQAMVSSFFVICLWVAILSIEANKNGLAFAEYVPIVFRGSFTFVPFLPAIERGTKNGISVNWTDYKMSLDGIGSVAKALTNERCKLENVKISLYTLKDLHRFGCRYFGQMLLNSPKQVSIMVSRSSSDIKKLFELYDIDNSQSYNFKEFSRVCLVMKQGAREKCMLNDIEKIFLELADSFSYEIWLLDLILKLKSSTKRIQLLDYDLPLLHAYRIENLNLISFLAATGYNNNNKDEFNYCVSQAIIENKIDFAMALCEHIGVPILVRIECCKDLLQMDEDNLSSDAYVSVKIGNDIQKTDVKKETTNPIFNSNLLFIIDFDRADRMLGKVKEITTLRKKTNNSLNKSLFSVNGRQTSVYNIPDSKNTTQNIFVYDKTFYLQESNYQMQRANVSSYGGSHKLKLNINVYDWDLDKEDDFIGQYQKVIDLSSNFATLHKNTITGKLQNKKNKIANQRKELAGSISFKIYLNVLDEYRKNKLKFIDQQLIKRNTILTINHLNHLTNNTPIVYQM